MYYALFILTRSGQLMCGRLNVTILRWFSGAANYRQTFIIQCSEEEATRRDQFISSYGTWTEHEQYKYSLFTAEYSTHARESHQLGAPTSLPGSLDR